MKLNALTPFGFGRVASNDTWPGSIFSLHREVDRIFDDFVTAAKPKDASQHWNPRLNIAETPAQFQISVELPGVAEKDVDISLNDGLLTIKGQRATETEEKDKNYHRVESFYGSFQRQIALPDVIDADRIEATFKNGMLDVIVPKLAVTPPKERKIKLKSA